MTKVCRIFTQKIKYIKYKINLSVKRHALDRIRIASTENL